MLIIPITFKYWMTRQHPLQRTHFAELKSLNAETSSHSSSSPMHTCINTYQRPRRRWSLVSVGEICIWIMNSTNNVGLTASSFSGLTNQCTRPFKSISFLYRTKKNTKSAEQSYIDWQEVILPQHGNIQVLLRNPHILYNFKKSLGRGS